MSNCYQYECLIFCHMTSYIICQYHYIVVTKLCYQKLFVLSAHDEHDFSFIGVQYHAILSAPFLKASLIKIRNNKGPKMDP